MLPHLSISVSARGPDLLFSLAGELDGCSRADVMSEATSAASAFPKASVVLDLSKVSFIDCNGLGTLIMLRNLARGSDRSVVIAQCSPSVERLLHMTNLCTAFSLAAPALPPVRARARRPRVEAEPQAV